MPRVEVFDETLLPPFDRLKAVLVDYDPVTQQKLLELACAAHALRAPDPKTVKLVTDGMHKHILQIIAQTPAR